jgi:signal transduction histidine kinase
MLALGLWCVVALIAATALAYERSQAIDFARRSAQATVALMEEHTASTFRAVSLALEETAQVVTAAKPERDDAKLREEMRSHLRDMPYVRAIFVIDETGTIVHDTDFPATPKISLADRWYFKAHQGDPALVGMIASPLQSRSGTGWFVPVTRRVASDGGFKGVAVAAIQLRYFNDLYLRMGLGEGQRTFLYHRDGTLVAQYPPDDSRVGTSFAAYPLFKDHLPQSPRGAYQTSGPPAHKERIFAYAAVESQPIVVAMAYDLDAVLAGWRRALLVSVLGLALLFIALGGAVHQYVSHESQRQRIRDRFQQGEKLEALGQLTGGIAHDFGNVLGIVNNNIELIDRLLPEKDARLEKSIASARRAIATGTRLTRDLMGFARKRELDVVVADLGNVLARVEPMLRHAAGDGVHVDVSAEGNCTCRLDVNQLEVALINLVVNARDAMLRQGSIRIEAVANDPSPVPPAAGEAPVKYTSIKVTDTGPGMPEDVQKRAFEPFFTTKGEQGTGLGLSQVYGFVKQVGGELAIDSAPGQGTSVTLYFPLVET